MIEKLKDIAFRIHIDPLKTVEHAAKVETVIKVLSDIYQSYNNYLEIEFLRNEEFRKVFESNKKVLDTIKEELSLLVVDLNFSSFEAALAPNIIELQSPIFKNEVLEWKRETYDKYKNSIISGDFDNPNYLLKIVKRYNDEERVKIFKPLFSSFGDGKEYRINIKDKNHKILKTLIQPEKNKEFFIPKISVEKIDLPEYSTVQVFAKIRKQGDKFNLNQRNLKEILYLEELEHDTYPFKPDLIKFQNIIFVLSKNLECIVEFEDDNYIIKNEELDLIVWGETRKEVEDAFNFSFYSLYTNYFLEDDSKLSDGAIRLKNGLKTIIKSVINEA
ncbi:MAG: hypothetical protein Q8T04_06810 [Bacteroidota bacterium]|nr:hypothetical protein [Bacteroidota bacterium]